VHALAEEGNAAAAALHTKDLVAALATHHASNGALVVRLTAPLARVACGDSAILSQTAGALARAAGERGVRGDPAVASRVNVELARQRILSGDLQARLDYLASPQQRCSFFLISQPTRWPCCCC
jgi:hypothetical protein